MKVLFVHPPNFPLSEVKEILKSKRSANDRKEKEVYINMPMGILYLAAVLERDCPDSTIKIVDFMKSLKDFVSSNDRTSTTADEFFYNEFDRLVDDNFAPDMVGISILFSTAHNAVIPISKAIKQKWPNTKIVVGGMHATSAVESLLSISHVDYVARGEGESIIVDVAKACVEKSDLEKIQGVIGRNKFASDKKFKTELSKRAPMIDNLDEIPFPAWHLIPMDDYSATGRRVRQINKKKKTAYATILTTRGCPFKCTFCASWTVHGRTMRYRSTENVLRELEILHNRYNVSLLSPEDDLFTVKKPRIIELCNAIADKFEGKLSFEFPNGLSVATLDEDVVAALCRINVKLVNVAIESGSDYVQRKIIKKNCDLKRAVRVCKAFRNAGVMVRTFFIVGFPGETVEQINETFDYIHNLPVDWGRVAIAAPLPGSEMYDQFVERGDINHNLNMDYVQPDKRMYDTEEISADELNEKVELANLRINFFDNYNFRNKEYDRAIKCWSEVIKFYPDHLAAQYCIALAYKKKGNDKKYSEEYKKCLSLIKSKNNTLSLTHLRTMPDRFPTEFILAAKFFPLKQFKIGTTAKSLWQPQKLFDKKKEVATGPYRGEFSEN